VKLSKPPDLPHPNDQDKQPSYRRRDVHREYWNADAFRVGRRCQKAQSDEQQHEYESGPDEDPAGKNPDRVYARPSHVTPQLPRATNPVLSAIAQSGKEVGSSSARIDAKRRADLAEGAEFSRSDIAANPRVGFRPGLAVDSGARPDA